MRWHRHGWRLLWRWKSRSRGGRPHLSPEIQDLIVTMARENRLWDTDRIRGELLKLGIVVMCVACVDEGWEGWFWRRCLRTVSEAGGAVGEDVWQCHRDESRARRWRAIPTAKDLFLSTLTQSVGMAAAELLRSGLGSWAPAAD